MSSLICRQCTRCECSRRRKACHCHCHTNFLELFVTNARKLGVHFYLTLEKEKKTTRNIDALSWNQVPGSEKKKLTEFFDLRPFYLDEEKGDKVALNFLFSFSFVLKLSF